MAHKHLTNVYRKNNVILQKLSIATDHVKPRTAGIIVVGDEILKGEVPDTNSTFLAKQIHGLGLLLKKITVIGDNVVEVSSEVKQFSKSYDYVITTGGIGPTHDDITFEAVAHAFDEPLVLNPELKELCMKFYKTNDPQSPGMKLAYIPQSAKLNFYRDERGIRANYPNISVKNVYIFPGIPEFLRKSFINLAEILFRSDHKFYTKCIYLRTTEDKIVEALDMLVKQYPAVQFGSYPKLYNSSYNLKVTIESRDEDMTIRAQEKLLRLVPKDIVVDVNDT